jgi:hypothetical protein
MQQARQLAQGMQIRPHAVPRNSLPEMAQVDRWARGVALGELDTLTPTLPPTSEKPTPKTSRRTRKRKPPSQSGLFSNDEGV